jgi:hypothetical protein
MKESRPRFRLGQHVLIDVLAKTGKISIVHGFDSMIGANCYEVTLDGSGKEVEWTEKHLSAIEDTRT